MPDLIFLFETKIKAPRVDRIKNILGFASCQCVDSVGKAGGLALFWKLSVELKVVFENKYVITALVYSDPTDTAWLLILVHGPQYLAKRRKFWNLMADIISDFSRVWLLIGDLNSTASSSNKFGSSSNGEASSRSFRQFSNTVGAIDLGFNGPKYTWSNRRVGWANIRQRLDHGICNIDWQSLFPKAGVRHLIAGVRQSNSSKHPPGVKPRS